MEIFWNLKQVLFCFLFFACATSICPHDAWDLLYEYDVIVVGSGIGGSVAARKLAEQNPTWNVLLVERGISWDQCKSCADPGAGLKAYFDPTTGPLINSAPQAGSFSKKITIKDTMVQGGSTALNLMYHIRCDSENYFNLHWPASWNWTSVKPYIKRYENYSAKPSFNYSENYRGDSGLVKVTQDLDHGGGLVKTILEKLKAIYPNMPVYENNTLNNEGFHGVGAAPQEFFATAGLRSSAYIAYIKSYSGKNLKTVTQVRVNRVLFNGTTAIGVELQLVKDGRGHSSTCIIKASRAVIVSAGALGSPKLLKLSGVGPRTELEALGIPVVVDNEEVGANLNDHAIAIILCDSTNYNIPFSSGYPNSFGAFYWNVDDTPGARPDIYVSVASERMLEINVAIVQTTFMNTNSYGSVKLASSNPEEPPIVDPGYFANSTDKKIYAKGFAKSFALAKNMGCNFVYDLCAKDSCKTDSELLDKYLQAGHNVPGYHFAGSCAVNKVVDEDSFSVIGTQKLFVIDASVLPYAPPGNPSSVIYMVAERVSDRINELLQESAKCDCKSNGEVTFPQYSYVEGSQNLIKIAANQPTIYSFKIVAVSSMGVPRTSGGDYAKVTVHSTMFITMPIPSKIEDQHDGTYNVEITIKPNMVGVLYVNAYLNYELVMHGSMSLVVALA